MYFVTAHGRSGRRKAAALEAIKARLQEQSRDAAVIKQEWFSFGGRPNDPVAQEDLDRLIKDILMVRDFTFQKRAKYTIRSVRTGKNVTLAINESTYQWSVRLFGLLRKVVRVNVKLHDPARRIESGDIFLFNHFARFETFIPQYLIYLETAAYCRSIAAPEFFREDDAFGEYLRAVGAVPNDTPDLLPLLAAEVLRGRRVVVFPEGGMVKDRRVLDAGGGYSVYSRTAHARRKHHTGAAVVALALEAIKLAIRDAHARGHERRVEDWAARLGGRVPEPPGRARAPTPGPPRPSARVCHRPSSPTARRVRRDASAASCAPCGACSTAPPSESSWGMAAPPTRCATRSTAPER